MRLHLLLSFFALGCGSSTPPEPPRASTPADYDVHEWGLVRGGPSDVLQVGGIAPPIHVDANVQNVPVTVEKPVLYFHAAEEVHLASVRVEPVGGVVHEHWPLTASPSPNAIEWTGLTLAPAQHACALRVPSANEPPCRGLGEECESSQLAQVVASDSTCVTGSHGTSPLLFYRSDTRTFTPPLTVRRDGETMQVTNGTTQTIPGQLVRIWAHRGQTVVVTSPPPGPQGTVAIESPAVVHARLGDPGGEEPSLDAGRAAVRETMRALGMTDAETGAFLEAWNVSLFGAPPTSGGGRTIVLEEDRATVEEQPSEESERRPAPVRPVESLLYFLPETSCGDVARLTFDPAPRSVRRALAVWVRVP